MIGILRFLPAAALVLLVCLTSHPQAPVSKIELGAQFTSFRLFPPPQEGFQTASVTEPGVGGRLTYNLNRRIAIDSEINFFPNKNIFQFAGEGRALQLQIGVKAGKRFRNFGVFAKARPGFLSIGRVFFYEPGASLDTGFGFSIPNARIDRRTHFTTDLGAVVEFYPSRRTIVRFDAGDTLVRYSQSFEPINFDPAHLTTVPARIKHNFQFAAGIGWRFPEPTSNQPAATSSGTGDVSPPRYEVGVQFASISFDPPTVINSDVVIQGPEHVDTQPGFGGRFTFNLNRSLALEAEGDFYPAQQNLSGGGGRLVQTQFGVKAGHRWRRFGLFGKVRPGMLSFTQVTQLVSLQPVGNTGFQTGVFRSGWKSYFSVDAGGVIEHYVTRHFMTRIDLGDTIVHYSEYDIPSFILSIPFRRRSPETHHNFQFTAGVGWRF